MTVTDTYRQTDYAAAANRYSDVLLPQAHEMLLRTPGRRFTGTCTEFVNEVHRMAGIDVCPEFADATANALVPAIRNMGADFELEVVDHAFVGNTGTPQERRFRTNAQHIVNIRWRYND